MAFLLMPVGKVILGVNPKDVRFSNREFIIKTQIEACLSPKVYIFLLSHNGGVQYYFNYEQFYAYCYFLIPLY